MRGDEADGDAAPVEPSGSAGIVASPSSDTAAAFRFLVLDGVAGFSPLAFRGLAVLLGVEESRVLRGGVVCVTGIEVSGLNLKFSMSSLPLKDEVGSGTPMLASSFSTEDPILSV